MFGRSKIRISINYYETLQLLLIYVPLSPQPKVPLIQEVVRIMGIEKSFEIFKQTSEIQSQGGQIAADANYK